MKQLGLLRHAKSSWGDPALDDFDRPLNERGRDAASRMGVELSALELRFDLALVSPARRAANTFALVRDGWGSELRERAEPRLYAASVGDLLAIIAETPAHIERLLLVGHNPGLHELAVRIAQAGPEVADLAAKFPTGALAEIELPIRDWAAIGEKTGRLVRFVRPRDLD